MIQHLPRWIYASITKHFASNALIDLIEDWTEDDYSTWPMILDLSDELSFNKNHLELRIDGPFINEQSKNYFMVDCEINILISVFNPTNIHTMPIGAGIAVAAMTPIKLYKYGDGVDDDSSLIGCMTLKTHPSGARGDRLEVRNYQQIDKDLKLYQSTVEGHYETNLSF